MSPKLFNSLIVLIAPVIYYGYLAPAYTGNPGLVWTPEKSIVGLQAENVQYKNSINQFDLIQSEAEKIYSDYKKVPEETKTKISIMLPDTVDQIKIRNEVVNIGARANVAIQGLKVEKELKIGAEGLESYNINFSIRSRYPAFKKFMELYEKNMRLFVLDSASIRRQEKRDGDTAPIEDTEALDISISSKVYYMKK